MSPRASLPGADELFRATSPRPPSNNADNNALSEREEISAERDHPAPDRRTRGQVNRRAVGERSSTGRERHEEKITVYVSAAELVDLERARLTLRAELGIAVDRGRIVREALSVVLSDFEAKHGDSILVRRLAEQ